MRKQTQKIFLSVLAFLAAAIGWSLLKQWNPVVMTGVERNLTELFHAIGRMLANLLQWGWIYRCNLAGAGALLLLGGILWQKGWFKLTLAVGLGLYWLFQGADLPELQSKLAAVTFDTALLTAVMKGMGSLGALALAGILVVLMVSSLGSLCVILRDRRPDKAIGTAAANLLSSAASGLTKVGKFMVFDDDPKMELPNSDWDYSTDYINPL